MATLIEFQGLTKRFGSLLAVDDLTFGVEPGEIVGFLGPNGAGKTTTLRMLLGLVRPTAGTAILCGHPYRELRDPLRRVGVVLEGAGAHPARTARAHLRMQAMASGSGVARVDEMLDLVGLTRAGDRRVGQFSLGMRQRLGLAAALLPDPDVLILDEPTNGLDPEGVRWLRDLLRAQADGGRTVLVSSHLLAEVAQSVDSVVILNRGRLVTQAPLARLLSGTGSASLEDAFMRLTAGPTGGAAAAVMRTPTATARVKTRTETPGVIGSAVRQAPSPRWLVPPLAAAAVAIAVLLAWTLRRRSS